MFQLLIFKSDNFQNRFIWLIDETQKRSTTPDLGVLKGYSTFSRALEQEPHHQMHTHKTLLQGI